VVAGFDDARCQVEVDDVLGCCSVTKKDSNEVMSFELAPSEARLFDADTRTKRFKVLDIWLCAVPRFVWSLVGGGVNKTVLEEDCVEEGSRPEFCWKPRAIQKGPNLHGKRVVEDLRPPILGGAVSPSGFDHIPLIPEHCCNKFIATGKFAALARPEEAASIAEVAEKGQADIDWGILGQRKEGPTVTGGTINDEEVGAIPVV
jgi:hypothetical protein